MIHSTSTILSRLSRQPATHSWLAHHADAVRLAVSRGVRNTRTRSLTIFRMGLGRDSLAMLGLLLEGSLVANGRTLVPA